MSATETQVLAGILPDSPARMERAVLNQLTPSNFSSDFHRSLFEYMLSYYDEHMAILPKWAMSEKSRRAGVSAERIKLMEAIYDEYSRAEVPQSDFNAAMQFLKEEEITRRTDEAIVTAREILQGTYYDEKTDTVIRGQRPAREYLTDALRLLDTLETEAAPEGDIRDDMEKIWKEYLKKESTPEEESGIKYGIKEVDEFTGGLHPGELALFAGFTGSGKSQLVTSLAWSTMLAGKNVLMFTTETTREEMEIRVIARHSRLPQFKSPRGLDSHEITNATLSPNDKDVFREVLKDFRERDTGRLFMVQMPSDGRADYVVSKSYQYNRKDPISLIIVDSINLLRTSGKPENKRVMLEDLLQDFKRLASSFDGGRGVAIASPWQMSRTAWREALEAGGVYTLASLSDTAEAERCQPLHSKVLTPTGFISMRDVKVGTEIMTPEGKSSPVLETHDNGKRPVYEVTTDDGAVVECTPGHVWKVQVEGKKRFELLTTADIQKILPDKKVFLPSPTGDLKTDEDFSPVTMYEAHYVASALREINPYPGVLTLTPDEPDYVSSVFKTQPSFAYMRGSSKKITFEFSEESLRTLPIYRFLKESNLFSGERKKFRFSDYYLNVDSVVKHVYLLTFLKEQAVLHTPPPLGWWKPRNLVSKELKKQVDSMILSNGWPLSDSPRRIASVTDTGRVEDTKCFTVKGGLYITDGYVVTHNSPSQIISLFKESDSDGTTRLGIQVLKNRSGREMPKIVYPVDYRNSFIGAASDAADMDEDEGKSARPEDEVASFNSALDRLIS